MFVPTRHAIQAVNDTFNFALWRGAGPRFVSQNTETFTRNGADSTGFQLTGTRGRAFEAELVAYFPTFIDAQNRRIAYKGAIGNIVYVRWEDEYMATVRHRYFCLNVRTQSIQSMPRVTGNNYNYVYGTEIVTRWLLLPLFTG